MKIKIIPRKYRARSISGGLLHESVFEKSFLQSARPTLRYNLPEFSCRSPLRRPHPDQISHKL